MKKGMNFSVVVIGLLVVAIVAMSIGFASFAQNLNITGNTTVQSTSWNVQFKTDSYSETAGSMTVDTGNRVINATSMTYNVTLSKPGEFYEFTIDVENTGTFDAQLEGITMSSLTTEQQKYLVYKITYDGTEYTTTTSSLAIDLLSGNTETVKVRVEYIQPDNPDDLPDSQQVITLNAALDYVQKQA